MLAHHLDLAWLAPHYPDLCSNVPFSEIPPQPHLIILPPAPNSHSTPWISFIVSIHKIICPFITYLPPYTPSFLFPTPPVERRKWRVFSLWEFSLQGSGSPGLCGSSVHSYHRTNPGACGPHIHILGRAARGFLRHIPCHGRQGYSSTSSSPPDLHLRGHPHSLAVLLTSVQNQREHEVLSFHCSHSPP